MVSERNLGATSKALRDGGGVDRVDGPGMGQLIDKVGRNGRRCLTACEVLKSGTAMSSSTSCQRSDWARKSGKVKHDGVELITAKMIDREHFPDRANQLCANAILPGNFTPNIIRFFDHILGVESVASPQCLET